MVRIRTFSSCLYFILLSCAACDGNDTTDAGQPVDVSDAGRMDADGGNAGPGDAGSMVIDGGDIDAGNRGTVDAGPGAQQGEYPPGEIVYTGNYWNSVETGQGQTLIQRLHDRLVQTHSALSYAAVTDAYLSTDGSVGMCDGIYDYYSDYCWDPSDDCGTYNSEGDCYNREHSWPKSWWGGSESETAYTDLFHVIPADGYVNNRRSNHPLDVVTSATYTSGNGSLIGACTNAEGSALCFEPIDSLKGDLARIYFYMSTRYAGEFDCCDRSAVNGAHLKPWAEALLREWHTSDLVDQRERDRNEAVFELQGNRNPFVDNPYWVDDILDF